MRALHPLSPDERFVASGEYLLQPAGVVERWSVHEQKGGALLVRLDRDSRSVNGRSLLAEVWCSLQGSPERFSLHAYGGPQDAYRSIRVDATIFVDNVMVGYSADNQPRQDAIVPLSCPAAVCPDGVVFRGLALRWAAQVECPVVLIGHGHAAHEGAWPFYPAALAVASPPECVETARLVVDGRAISAQHWRWFGLAGFEGDWWLDLHGAVLRRVLPDSSTQTLRRYARRVELVEDD